MIPDPNRCRGRSYGWAHRCVGAGFRRGPGARRQTWHRARTARSGGNGISGRGPRLARRRRISPAVLEAQCGPTRRRHDIRGATAPPATCAPGESLCSFPRAIEDRLQHGRIAHACDSRHDRHLPIPAPTGVRVDFEQPDHIIRAGAKIETGIVAATERAEQGDGRFSMCSASAFPISALRQRMPVHDGEEASHFES